MPEVKKPRQLNWSIWKVAAAVEKIPRWKTFIYVNSMGASVSAEEARRLARWLDDYAAWAKSLEPEFDERNE